MMSNLHRTFLSYVIAGFYFPIASTGFADEQFPDSAFFWQGNAAGNKQKVSDPSNKDESNTEKLRHTREENIALKLLMKRRDRKIESAEAQYARDLSRAGLEIRDARRFKKIERAAVKYQKRVEKAKQEFARDAAKISGNSR